MVFYVDRHGYPPKEKKTYSTGHQTSSLNFKVPKNPLIGAETKMDDSILFPVKSSYILYCLVKNMSISPVLLEL